MNRNGVSTKHNYRTNDFYHVPTSTKNGTDFSHVLDMIPSAKKNRQTCVDFDYTPAIMERRIFSDHFPKNAHISGDLVDERHDVVSVQNEIAPSNAEKEGFEQNSSPMSSAKSSSDVWKARLLLILSAALYGTNFTMVKELDESLSVGLCSTLRFGFAALSMIPFLLAPINEELKVMSKQNALRRDMNQRSFSMIHGEEPTRLSAGLAGLEIGMWNSIGYIAQAVGLKTTTACKVCAFCNPLFMSSLVFHE